MTKNSTESNAGLKNSKITVNPDTFKATEIDANNSDLQNQGINIDNNYVHIVSSVKLLGV